jgi:hypothetical protein
MSDQALKRARELVAEWESQVDRLSPSPFDNTERERGRAEAYASCARELSELLPALDAWAEEARLEEAKWWDAKIGHSGPVRPEWLDTSCEYCMRIAKLEQAKASKP